MIKVLHILTDSNIGGAGHHLLALLKHFDRAAFEITVLLPENAALTEQVRLLGYPVIEAKYGRDRSLDLRAIGEYRRIIESLCPDTVHTHSSLSGRIAAWLAGVKSRIYTRHCVFEVPKRLTRFPGKQLNRALNRTLSTAIIAVADAARDNLTEAGVERDMISVILNGTDPLPVTSPEEKAELKRSLAIPEHAFVCGISARLEEYKGHAELLAAARQVIAEDGSVYFLIMGTGTCEAALHAQAEEYGIADHVIFTGFVSDVAPYCNIFSLNLNCSWGTEASSMAIAEAMSLSVPTVATDYGGNVSLIEDGVNGILVPTHSPDAIAEAILRLRRDPKEYGKMQAGAAKIYAERLKIEKTVAETEELYRRDYRSANPHRKAN